VKYLKLIKTPISIKSEHPVLCVCKRGFRRGVLSVKAGGRIDLILADPPYNTGNDFRYNDKWDTDPNDPDLGDIVSPDGGSGQGF
jgi:hypothetical protein